jgi:diketogulonate reductase-like aldo/keto reductase
MLTRLIPTSNELLPVLGLGTWQCFDVAKDSGTVKLQQVLHIMDKAGATLIDSSPMYGRSEEMIGHLIKQTGHTNKFFYATKVWTEGKEAGIRQMNDSMRKMGCDIIDLMQIHNLVDWKTHMGTLTEWKAAGKVRYIGITHYTDEMHGELEKIISTVPLDFVQFNYSILNRHAESRLLPAALQNGVATLINRPLGIGKLFDVVQEKALPIWAAEYNIKTWSQFFLKFLISHPAVTCVIPATSDPEHMRDNLHAAEGNLPDEHVRKEMWKLVSEF